MKKIITFFIIIIMLVSVVACNKDTETVTIKKSISPLISNGKSNYTIVISKDSDSCIKYASEELRSYVYESTGVYLDIIDDSEAISSNKNYISIGKTQLLTKSNINVDYTTFNQDGFFIKSVGKNIYINGALERGTLYGVYSFLERNIGIRFLTADCTYVPKLSYVKLYEMDIIDIPDFSMRLYLTGDTYAYFGDAAFAARSKQDEGYLWNVDEKYGEKSLLYGYGLSDHNMHYFVDTNIYYNQEKHPESYHPEFYYEFPEPYKSYGPTLCLTNGINEDGTIDNSSDETVFKIVTEKMKEVILNNPTSIYFLFEQEDSYNFCTCDKCSRQADIYQRSGILIRFCNLMIEELKKWAQEINLNREWYIVTFAYSYSRQAPVKVVNGEYQPIDKSVIADDHLIIRIADQYNVNYNFFSKKQPSDRVQSLESWGKCASHFMMWIHDKDFADYLSYFPSIGTIKDNIIGMYNYGVVYAFIEGAENELYDWQSDIRGYIYRNLMWDIDADFDTLYNEFILYYWGESAYKYIKEFIEKYEENYAIAKLKNPDPYKYQISTLKTEYIDPKENNITLVFLENQISIIEKAKKAINENANYSFDEKQTYLKRVAMCEATPKNTLRRFYSDFYPSADNDTRIAFMKDFFSVCDFAGITLVQQTVRVSEAKARENIK